MKIERVEITNFRGIDHLALDFVDPAGKPLDLVVLAGPNGCGKTSVLEACLLSCEYQALPHGKEGNSFNIGLKSENAEIIIDIDAGSDKKFKLKNTLRSISLEDLVMSKLQNGADVFSEDSISAVWSFAKERQNASEMQKKLKDSVEYFSSSRQQVLAGGLPVAIAGNLESFVTEENVRLKILKSYCIDVTALRGFRRNDNSPKNDPVFESLALAWSYFYPHSKIKFEARPVDSRHIDDQQLNDVRRMNFDLFIVDDLNKKIVSVDKLSSGEIEILCMLGTFAIVKNKPKLLFIDEPELHLHPTWHRAILRALREVLPDTQIICATHSPDVLDAVEYYQRFVLLDENDPRVRLRNSRALSEGGRD
ncbi:MAG: AAA family ATPase [Deltaproteobacteria bacterium]|nr:AAA family ATPase [Deltaproteobacteria bacterium]